MNPRRIPLTLASGLIGFLGLAVLAVAPLAHAADNVYWSIGVAPAPNVVVSAGNARPIYAAPPVYVQPAPPPLYTYPQPVYTQPPVVYTQPPWYVQPAPVVVQPQPVFVPPGQWHHHHHHPHNGYNAYNGGYYRY